jgi:hypothetical protein
MFEAFNVLIFEIYNIYLNIYIIYILVLLIFSFSKIRL